MSDFKDKLRSINFAGKKSGPRKRVDDHGTHRVTTTTSDERQDVHVEFHQPLNKLGAPDGRS